MQKFVDAAGLAAEEGGDQGNDSVSEHHESQIFRANTTLLLNILAEINLELEMFAHTGLHQKGLPSESVTSYVSSDLNGGYSALLDRVSTILQKAPKSLGVFRSFTWSGFRKSEYETILRRLARCNDLLHDLLDDHQQRLLQKQQQEHNMELVQTRNSLSEIQKLIEAAAASKTAHSQSGKWQRTVDAQLEDLTSFKALYMSLLRDNEVKPHDIRIEASRIRIECGEQEKKNHEHPQAVYKSSNNEEKRVWINWQKNGIPGDASVPNSISPTEELAILLQISKPDEFCTPTCLGYSILQRDGTSPCPALIFKSPADFDLQNQPCSLFLAFTTYEKPSLPHRVMLADKLAQSLLYILATGFIKPCAAPTSSFFPRLQLLWISALQSSLALTIHAARVSTRLRMKCLVQVTWKSTGTRTPSVMVPCYRIARLSTSTASALCWLKSRSGGLL